MKDPRDIIIARIVPRRAALIETGVYTFKWLRRPPS
jgi:hypothetical protein